MLSSLLRVRSKLTVTGTGLLAALTVGCSASLAIAAAPARQQDVQRNQHTRSGAPSEREVIADTPATRQLASWLETFNAGDRAAWQRFLSEHAPSESSENIERNLMIRKMVGGFDLVRIETATATQAVALLKERDADGAARLTVDVRAAAPHQIVSVGLQQARIPIARLTEAKLVGALRGEIDKRVAADQFSGAVLVAKGDRLVFSGAYGMADRASASPNVLDTKFRFGSMGKMFTAVATLTLVQQGKLKLSDPVGKYLTDYPNQAVASKVTIHQLLTHTGGTGDIFGPEFAQRRLELRTHQDYVKLYGSRDPAFEPGSQMAYSNYGFVLLGAVIEKVSGQSYYDYLRDHVYKPAGMTSTGAEPEGSTPPGLAVGYMMPPGTDTWQVNTNTLPYRGTGAGGGYSTVGDLMKFANALAKHKLLNEHYTKLLWAGKVDFGPPGSGVKYAYGFVERILDGIRQVGHNGGAPGMNGDLEIFPDSGYVVVVLANRDQPAAQRMSDFIINRLPAR